MNKLEITTLGNRTGFHPGETLQGTVSWQLDETPHHVLIELFWYTKGKGTQDLQIISMATVEHPRAQQDHPLTLTLPQAPYSFSGKLISLIWAVEVIAYPSKITARFEFTMSASGKEISLVGTT